MQLTHLSHQEAPSYITKRRSTHKRQRADLPFQIIHNDFLLFQIEGLPRLLRDALAASVCIVFGLLSKRFDMNEEKETRDCDAERTLSVRLTNGTGVFCCPFGSKKVILMQMRMLTW
jgi:hypothetical protein